MPEKPASSTLTVTDPEAAKVLSDPKQLRFIAPFLGQERTVSDVARELGSSLSTTYRRVQRYCDLGLLKVTRELPRKGKAVKRYRAVADAFFVPNKLTREFKESFASWHGFFEQAARRGLEHAYGERLDAWGERIYRNASGIFSASLAKGPDETVSPLEPSQPAALTTAHDAVYLDFDDAKRLQRDLHDLLQTYLKKPGSQRYLVRLSLVPLPEDVELIM